MISTILPALLQRGLANLPTPPLTQRWSLVLCLMNLRLPSLGHKNLDVSTWVSKRLSRNTPPLQTKLLCYEMSKVHREAIALVHLPAESPVAAGTNCHSSE